MDMAIYRIPRQNPSHLTITDPTKSVAIDASKGYPVATDERSLQA